MEQVTEDLSRHRIQNDYGKPSFTQTVAVLMTYDQRVVVAIE